VTPPQLGDSERQAFLRDKTIKEAKIINVGPDTHSIYVEKIISRAKPGCTVIDVGCGTAHLIVELAKKTDKLFCVGLDISRAMVNTARKNSSEISGICIVQGDSRQLPFRDGSFDMVLNRLAECSLSEMHRVLKNGAAFLQFGLGPENEKEILNLFPERYEKDTFFIPKKPKQWKNEVFNGIRKIGFASIGLDDYEGISYYPSIEEIMDLIEMVPLVEDFDREKDKETVERLLKNREDGKGISITYHFTILEATKL